MKDKQIIDGVDVSGCEFYFYREGDEYPHRCSCYKDMYGCSVVCNLADCCENCTYKQLKRKEQECERLSADLKSLGYTVALQGNRDIDNAVDLFAKRIAKIENENSILKAEKEEIKKYLGISSKTIMERLIELQEFRDNYRDKLYQAEQTLAEIKEIAEKVYNDCNDCYRDTDTNCEVDCIDCTLGGKAKLAKQILQLISEVEL